VVQRGDLQALLRAPARRLLSNQGISAGPAQNHVYLGLLAQPVQIAQKPAQAKGTARC